MLSFPIQTLAHGAVQVASDLPPTDAIWLEGDVRPVSGIRVTGRLSGAGSDRFYFSGAFDGTAAGECRRCLVPVEFTVAGEVHLIFVDTDDETADEPDVYPLGDLGTLLDLRPAIREHWLLDASGLPLCRPDCKGLCATCGADLNTGPCACSPVAATT
ncbi:MAG: DUF177 domain-containing protein [Gemmatimonadaceae bacterium]